MTDSKFQLGALPPQDSEWQINKTAATIAFVNEALVYLTGKPRISPIRALESYVERLKSGQESLTEWLTVEGFLSKFS